MRPLGATAWSGWACDMAPMIESTAAATVTTRPPHAAGGLGFTIDPNGRFVVMGRKQPSFMGIDGDRKQRTANTTPDSVCENDELMAPLDWSLVPAKSMVTAPSDNVTCTFTSNVRPSSTPSLSMVNEPS